MTSHLWWIEEQFCVKAQPEPLVYDIDVTKSSCIMCAAEGPGSKSRSKMVRTGLRRFGSDFKRNV